MNRLRTRATAVVASAAIAVGIYEQPKLDLEDANPDQSALIAQARPGQDHEPVNRLNDTERLIFAGIVGGAVLAAGLAMTTEAAYTHPSRR